MELYGGIDLHSNNCVVVLLDEEDRVVYEKRLPNDLGYLLLELATYQGRVGGSSIPTTAAMPLGIAPLLRLKLLPEGHIYPKEERAVRDLLRKRSQLVRQKVTHILSIQNLMSPNKGMRLSAEKIRQLTDVEVERLLPQSDLARAVKSNLAVYRCLVEEIDRLEKVVKQRLKLRPSFQHLLTVDGIGSIRGLTIMLEMDNIGRFARVGQFASYCRCMESQKGSQGKRDCDAQSGRPQVGPGLLLHFAGSRALSGGAGLRMSA